MNSLIKEFNLHTVIHNDDRYIRCNDLKTKLHVKNLSKLIDKKYVIYEEMNDEKDIDNLIVEMFIHESQVKNIIKQVNNHPEHYNAHKILGIEQKYHKKDEIKILAHIYKHFRSDFNIIYQYSFLEFKLDVNIVIEIGGNGGLVIEIDEHNHNKYDEQSMEERQVILESCGFHFIRIDPKEYDKDEILEQIKKEIREYELIYSIDINPDALWKELQNKSIDKDFFNFIGSSIVCNKKYCVDFDDVVKYMEYAKKYNAKKLLLEKFTVNIDYIILKQEDLKNRDDIYCTHEVRTNKNVRGGHNREYIFLTKFAFYTFALLSQTRKGKQIRTWIVDVYTKYQELLIYTRRKMIEMKKNTEQSTSLKLYKDRTDAKLNRTTRNHRRQLNNITTKAEKYKTERDEFKQTTHEQKIELDNYRINYNQNIQEDKERQESIQFIKTLTEISCYVTSPKIKHEICMLINLIIKNI